MEYNTQIEPLINDLKNFHLREYLKSSTFKRFLVKAKLDDLWKQCYDYSKSENNIFAFGMDMEGWYCEDAFFCMLNQFFNQNKELLCALVLEILTSFKQYSKEEIDLSGIIEDLDILSCPQNILDALYQLGQDYGTSEKALIQQDKNTLSSHANKKTKSKIFISHSANDEPYVEKLVSLLEHIGLQKNHIFCSSVPEYGIPLGQDIYEYLRNEFQEYNLYVIFVLSENYYKSAACLNEMGAAWILQSDYQALLLPGFDFKYIKGAINPGKVSFNLDNKKERRSRINQLKDSILNYLQISLPDSDMWERHREKFFEEIDSLKS